MVIFKAQCINHWPLGAIRLSVKAIKLITTFYNFRHNSKNVQIPKFLVSNLHENSHGEHLFVT